MEMVYYKLRVRLRFISGLFLANLVREDARTEKREVLSKLCLLRLPCACTLCNFFTLYNFKAE